MDRVDMYYTILAMVLFVVATIFDIKSRRIPVLLLVVFAFAGTVLAVFAARYTFWELITGISVGLVMIIISLVTKGQIGFGDALLFVVSGLFSGKGNIGLLMLSLFLCAMASGALFVTGQVKRKDRIPFVPFVLMAYIGQLLINI